MKVARESMKLTQDQLAAKAGVSTSTVSRIETGKAEPEKETLDLLAPHLKKTTAELLGASGAVPAWVAEDGGDPYPSRVEFVNNAPTTAEERVHLRSLRYAFGDPGAKEWKDRLESYRKLKAAHGAKAR